MASTMGAKTKQTHPICLHIRTNIPKQTALVVVAQRSKTTTPIMM